MLIEIGKKQVATYQRHICRILQDFFFVRVVLSETYKPATNEVHKAIELLGTSENVAIAEYCCHFLENGWLCYGRSIACEIQAPAAPRRTAFTLGWSLGFGKNYRNKTGGERELTSPVLSTGSFWSLKTGDWIPSFSPISQG